MLWEDACAAFAYCKDIVLVCDTRTDSLQRPFYCSLIKSSCQLWRCNSRTFNAFFLFSLCRESYSIKCRWSESLTTPLNLIVMLSCGTAWFKYQLKRQKKKRSCALGVKYTRSSWLFQGWNYHDISDKFYNNLPKVSLRTFSVPKDYFRLSIVDILQFLMQLDVALKATTILQCCTGLYGFSYKGIH